MSYNCITHLISLQVGRTAQEVAEEKGHTQIVEILKSVKEHSASEEDTSISHPVEGAPGRSGDLEGDAPKSEGDGSTRRGVFQRMKEWFQKDIKLVSFVIMASMHTYFILCHLCIPLYTILYDYALLQNRAAVRGSLVDVQKALQNKANPNGITNKLARPTNQFNLCTKIYTVIEFLSSVDTTNSVNGGE